ncbi:unnamed protein product [Blumeria hordei]|uniref:Uncharacterized protein n=1 Tax=Blumeria hordei TaxID=2867405 RepID=A0A383UHD4_BLUHO|nr:unnamed protein product [Blumeria hordei]
MFEATLLMLAKDMTTFETLDMDLEPYNSSSSPCAEFKFGKFSSDSKVHEVISEDHKIKDDVLSISSTHLNEEQRQLNMINSESPLPSPTSPGHPLPKLKRKVTKESLSAKIRVPPGSTKLQRSQRSASRDVISAKPEVL